MPGRQHRELDLARDLEFPLERQAIGDLEQQQQVDQDDADEQRERAVSPLRRDHVDLKNGVPNGTEIDAQPLIQLQDADQRNDQRDQIERAPRGRQLQREGDEDLADAQQLAAAPRLVRQPILVEPASEDTGRPRAYRA